MNPNSLRNQFKEIVTHFADFMDLEDGQYPGQMMSVTPDLEMTVDALIEAVRESLPQKVKHPNLWPQQGYNGAISEMENKLND